ncbi:phosphoribosyl-AMP cyclohydrolase [Alsobacter sp. SYSU M60028]|uniref:Phosphoribosyl-AMP cyclohydrolase n=1 Tax=Alsobacter ponti TaxID=2962936 RepID=A0ABT1LGW7_9HYPH|nr:phosphoribosyl-AMP cyclohydrolase [Alsobacter ponti]MCP8940348.1 phosphoribosyl-AMP cyclohydrolase [Alsobacter ponti]
MSDTPLSFAARGTTRDIEEGGLLAPKFDAAGLIAAVAVDADSGEVLMVAYMNEESLRRTLETGEAWYWSRSRGELWRKGDTSGQVQTVVEMRVDCDQDCLLLRVRVGGDGGCCHTGRRSCFYRRVEAPAEGGLVRLVPA